MRWTQIWKRADGGRERERKSESELVSRRQSAAHNNTTEQLKKKTSLFKRGSTKNMQTHLKKIISPTNARILCLLHVPDFCFWLFSLLQSPTHPHPHTKEKCNRICGGVTFDGAWTVSFIYFVRHVSSYSSKVACVWHLVIREYISYHLCFKLQQSNGWLVISCKQKQKLKQILQRNQI